MDPIAAFLWDIFKNVLGNRADAFFFGKKQDVPPTSLLENPPKPDVVPDLVPPRRFKTFDAVYDLENILSYVEDPVVYLLVEDSPSTAYNLPCYVLESASTGEWFVFRRGRLALQGSGGGHQNIEGVFLLLSNKKAKIGAWVANKKQLDQFESGQVLWPKVKEQSVPLLAFLSDAYSWSEIRNKFRELSTSKSP